MARRKQRANKGQDEVAEHPKSGLPYAWPSSPHRNPRFALYCTNHETDRRYIVNAYSCYAIRKIFDALVGENEIEPSPLDPDRTMTFKDIDLMSPEMDKILAHHYSKEEDAWELPAPYPNDIEQFLFGRRMSQSLEQRTASEGPNPQQVPRQPKAPKTPRVDRSQFITVQSLAEELKLDPRDARAALRKAKVDKPQGGWLGDEAWAKGIRTILAAAAKELAKRGKK